MRKIRRHGVMAIVRLTVVAGLASALSQAWATPPQADSRLRQAEDDYRRGLQAADGIGRPQDYVDAAKYYRKAAESGYVPAQYNLAYLYENGLGVMQDFAQAAAWYRKAADQGDAEAQNNLGTLYSTGQGVPHDDAEAVRLYSLAAAQGDPEGTTNLASMLLRGRGVARDTARAFQLFSKAARSGFAVAQNNLALMYANGEACRRDFIQAYAWLDVAADGIPNAAVVRDALSKQLTPAQVTEARRVAVQKRKELEGKDGKTR
ncbi:MAG TPA: SEL1-like repeat protein [Bryobacteraceae bacterium]|nr:SEL1-like repeat protein [Bryobacteraceae bacterium]